MLGGWEIILILAVVLILFGAKKLPELAKGLGQGIKEFKKATTDVTNEISRAVEDDPYRPSPPVQRAEYTEPKKLPDSAAPAADAPKAAAASTPEHKA